MKSSQTLYVTTAVLLILGGLLSTPSSGQTPTAEQRGEIQRAIGFDPYAGIEPEQDQTLEASEGYVNEAEPRAGESRANLHQYLASHNSYQGDISLAEALDEWNVWAIELDVRWRDDSGFPCFGGTGFYVMHHCFDLDGQGWLDAYLAQIAGTARMQTGFFFLNLEAGDGYVCLGCGGTPLFPTNWLERLENDITALIPRSKIYTWQNFVADNMQWPSPEELVRRGKAVAIHMNSANNTTNIFFKRTSTLGATGDPIAVWNTGDAYVALPAQGDRYLTRRYPEAYCALEHDGDWLAALNNGFNFPSTNCIEEREMGYSAAFQPPEPSWLQSLPLLFPEHGTKSAPYRAAAGLVRACERSRHYNSRVINVNRPGGRVEQRHPSKPTINCDSWIPYDVSGNGSVLDGPVILRNVTPQNGPVRLE